MRTPRARNFKRSLSNMQKSESTGQQNRPDGAINKLGRRGGRKNKWGMKEA